MAYSASAPRQRRAAQSIGGLATVSSKFVYTMERRSSPQEKERTPPPQKEAETPAPPPPPHPTPPPPAPPPQHPPPPPSRHDPSACSILNALDCRFNRMNRCAQPLVAEYRRLISPPRVSIWRRTSLQREKRSFSCNVVRATDFFLRNQTESPAHRLRVW